MDYWKRHEKRLLKLAPRHLAEEKTQYGKYNTAGDWACMIFPFLPFSLILQITPFGNQYIDTALAFVALVVFVFLCEMARPHLTGKRPLTQINNDIKNYWYQKYKEKGISALDDALSR